ncbi:MAG: type II toxin-antitoxin system HipA family toxin [Synechococcaceae cyanobacterium]|nr:type II toxin-antitoxin system HipA family toxin [Synechococcaceae cyanobacterium]
MAAADRECFVYVVLPGQTRFVTAGRFALRRDRRGGAVGGFVYGRSYRERSDAVELDPVELRLTPEQFQTARMGGLFGALRDALPDFWGRQVIERKAGLGVVSDFELLLLGPDDRAGALGFGRNLEPPAPQRRFNRTLDLAWIQETAESILNDKVPAAAVEQTPSGVGQLEQLLLAGGTSLGGARPKASVEDDQHLWLAKFPRPDDRWNQPRVEVATLQLARCCGIAVPECRLVRVGDRDVLLVRRFDRDWAGDGYRRHRMVSALTLLQSDESPTDRQRWSYLLLADEVRRASSHPADDLRELFTRLCFNAAVSNTDDHPRNHALLARGSSWRLSPAYDLTPGAMRTETERLLAMACGSDGSRWANRSVILSGAGRFLLSEQEAAAIVDHVCAVVSSQWRGCFRQAGVSEQDCERLAGAFVYSGLLL